ncbi:MAG: hypothetical protein HYT80_06910 [Euryarchaeota archaeon]|nr:hypothetical protein [Euryarchaeota archaeon]
MAEFRLLMRVAAEEASRYFRGFNRRVLLFIVLAGLAGGLLFPIILERGVVPDENLYRVDAFPGSPFLPAEARRRGTARLCRIPRALPR